MITISSEQKEQQLSQLRTWYKDYIMAYADDNYVEKYLDEVPSAHASLETLEMTYRAKEITLLQLNIVTRNEVEKIQRETEMKFGLIRTEYGTLIKQENEVNKHVLASLIYEPANPKEQVLLVQDLNRSVQQEFPIDRHFNVQIGGESYSLTKDILLTKNQKELDNAIRSNGNTLFTLTNDETFILNKLTKDVQKEPKLHWYEMTDRPISPGCQPKGFVKWDENKGKHGIVAYERPLTETELMEYDMKGWNANHDGIEMINQEKALEIINHREPKGLYYFQDENSLYVGIDNSSGDAWVEEFNDFESCERWLNNPNHELEKDNHHEYVRISDKQMAERLLDMGYDVNFDFEDLSYDSGLAAEMAINEGFKWDDEKEGWIVLVDRGQLKSMKEIYVGPGEVYMIEGLELDVEADYFSHEYFTKESYEEIEKLIKDNNIEPLLSKDGYVSVPENDDTVIYQKNTGYIGYISDFESVKKVDRKNSKNNELER